MPAHLYSESDHGKQTLHVLRQAGASEASNLHAGRRRRAGGATRTAAPMVLVSRLRCSSARKLRFRAVLPAPVALAGLPAEHQLVGDGPGRLPRPRTLGAASSAKRIPHFAWQRTYPRVQPAPARLCVIVFELGCRCALVLLHRGCVGPEQPACMLLSNTGRTGRTAIGSKGDLRDAG